MKLRIGSAMVLTVMPSMAWGSDQDAENRRRWIQTEMEASKEMQAEVQKYMASCNINSGVDLTKYEAEKQKLINERVEALRGEMKYEMEDADQQNERIEEETQEMEYIVTQLLKANMNKLKEKHTAKPEPKCDAPKVTREHKCMSEEQLTRFLTKTAEIDALLAKRKRKKLKRKVTFSESTRFEN